MELIKYFESPKAKHGFKTKVLSYFRHSKQNRARPSGCGENECTKPKISQRSGIIDKGPLIKIWTGVNCLSAF